MAIDFTGVTKVIQLDTYNNPETQTEIKRVYLGEALQWQKPQSPWVWQLVSSEMSEPWALNDLVVLVKFIGSSNNNQYYETSMVYDNANGRFYPVPAYPNNGGIIYKSSETTINNGLLLYHDETLGWCLNDCILPTQVWVVVRVSGKTARIRQNYGFLTVQEPYSTDTVSLNHTLEIKVTNGYQWWSAGVPTTANGRTTMPHPSVVAGTFDAPDASNPRWYLKGTKTIGKNTYYNALPTQPESTDKSAMYGFFKRVRIAQ